MQRPVGRKNVAGKDVERPAVIPGHCPAGFLNDERAGGDVPWIQFLFPEPVESPSRDVTEVQRGGAQATDRLRACQKRLEDFDLARPAVSNRVWKARADQSVDEIATRRHGKRAPVDPSARAALGG